MTSRKLSARALKFLPAAMILVAAVVQVRAQATLARAKGHPAAVTLLRGAPPRSVVSSPAPRPRRVPL